MITKIMWDKGFFIHSVYQETDNSVLWIIACDWDLLLYILYSLRVGSLPCIFKFNDNSVNILYRTDYRVIVIPRRTM